MDTRNGMYNYDYMNTIEPNGRVEILCSAFLFLFRVPTLGMIASLPGSAQVSVACSTVLEVTESWAGPGNKAKE